jgi:hypothetical protein
LIDVRSGKLVFMGDLSYIIYSLIAELLWDHWLGGNNAAGLWMLLGVAMIFIKNNKSSRVVSVSTINFQR